MKKSWKQSLIYVLVLLCMVVVSVPAFAAEKTQDGITVALTADKENYQEGETIVATLTVANNNSTTVEDLYLETLIPEGYKLSDDTKAASNIKSLGAGESVVLTTKLLALDTHGIPQDTKSPETGDNGAVYFVLAIGALAIAAFAIIVLKKKKGRNTVALVMSLVLVGASVTGLSVEAQSVDTFDTLSVEEVVYVDGNELTLNSQVKYSFTIDHDYLIDPDAEELAKVFKDCEGTIREDLSYSDQAVTGVEVSYILKDGSGFVEIEDATLHSNLRMAPGAIGAPVDIETIGDELQSATITFTYDESKLDDVKEQDLAICWYDEEDKIAKLADSSVDPDENTVSVHTDHFSTWVVVDQSDWINAWAQEQLVPRTDEMMTPYYNVIFALDSSGSMSGSNNALCREATYEFIKLLKGKDKVSIMSFDDDATVYLENQMIEETTLDLIKYRIDQVGANGGTNYQEGLSTALSLIVAAHEGESDSAGGDGIARQSLLVFLSDGEPTTLYNSETLEQLNYLAETAKCRCVTIGLGNGANEHYLEEMAEAGNGEYMHVDTPDQLPALFEIINNWYIGTTKDTDGDSIPDIVETTGMRTQFGYFVRTDPNNADTDGDGYSDGEEIGTFQYFENGKSYFVVKSDPTVPSYYSENSKAELTCVRMSPHWNWTGNVTNMSFEEIRDQCKNFTVTATVKAQLLEVAPDFLSETVYPDAVIDITINQEGKCLQKQGTTWVNTTVTAGSNRVFTLQNMCKNNLLDCKNSHKFWVDATNYTGKMITENCQYFIEDANTKYTAVMQRKKQKILEHYNDAEETFSKETQKVIRDIQKGERGIKNQAKEDVQNYIESVFAIQAPEDIENAFLKLFENQIDELIETDIARYSEVSTPKELVDCVTQDIKSIDGKIHFKVDKTPYVCEFKSIGSMGAAYIQGSITNEKNEKITYPFLGTKVNYSSVEGSLQEMKKLADAKIDEAVDAIISDAGKIISFDKLKGFIKNVTKRQIITMLDNRIDGFAQQFNEYSSLVNAFDKLNSAYEDVQKMSSGDGDIEKLPKKIESFNVAINQWYEAVRDYNL